MGEPEKAAEYTAIAEKGKAYLNKELFNGEYFYQKVDLKDKSILDPYAEAGLSLHKQDIYQAYWNSEQEELMYQIADGSAIDQILAQWHANLIGMGDIFDKEKVKSALKAIYKYNFIPDMSEVFNPCRLYCINDEGGLVICNWPKGTYKPVIPAPYAEETMNGFEYQAAIHMIQEGMVEQGMTCIAAIRERYDGEKRNPWNEFECGSNYARSMASYALLLTYSGFEYDMSKGYIGFAPIRENNAAFTSFWSIEGAWGSVSFADCVKVAVQYGALKLKSLKLAVDKAPTSVTVDGKDTTFSFADGVITFTNEITALSEIAVK